MTTRVLVVDDDHEMCELLRTGLARRGFGVEVFQTGDAALAALRESRFDVVVTDIKMRGMTGLELCERVSANRPDVPVIVITAFGSMGSAVDAMRAGAFDYIAKPLELDALAFAIERGAQHHALQDEVKRLRQEVKRDQKFERLIGSSEAMRALFDVLERISDSDSSVLIAGETGTGKELVARSLHERSARRDKPFMAVNCAAVPELLMESELFGHARGAFTGAHAKHVGLLAGADGGTVFLDEIAEMPIQLQPKLLRALQERVVRPVGTHTEVPFDVRIIAATNVDLESAVEQKTFRADLFFRLNVIHILVPRLSKRRGDILLLAQHFTDRYATRAEKRVFGLSPEAAKRLLAYDWPGNVRELQNCIEHAVALAEHELLTVDDLPEKLRKYRSWHGLPAGETTDLIPLRDVERKYIQHVLRMVDGNKRLAARTLGLDRATLYRKLARYENDDEPES